MKYGISITLFFVIAQLNVCGLASAAASSSDAACIPEDLIDKETIELISESGDFRTGCSLSAARWGLGLMRDLDGFAHDLQSDVVTQTKVDALQGHSSGIRVPLNADEIDYLSNLIHALHRENIDDTGLRRELLDRLVEIPIPCKQSREQSMPKALGSFFQRVEMLTPNSHVRTVLARAAIKEIARSVTGEGEEEMTGCRGNCIIRGIKRFLTRSRLGYNILPNSMHAFPALMILIESMPDTLKEVMKPVLFKHWFLTYGYLPYTWDEFLRRPISSFNVSFSVSDLYTYPEFFDDFRIRRIEGIPYQLFDHYELYFVNKNITSLEGIARIANRDAISRINLSGNGLTEIKKNDFDGFIIHILDLSYNRLSDIDEGTFARLRYLIYLNLSGNRLSQATKERIIEELRSARLPNTVQVCFDSVIYKIYNGRVRIHPIVLGGGD